MAVVCTLGEVNSETLVLMPVAKTAKIASTSQATAGRKLPTSMIARLEAGRMKEKTLLQYVSNQCKYCWRYNITQVNKTRLAGEDNIQAGCRWPLSKGQVEIIGEAEVEETPTTIPNTKFLALQLRLCLQ